jgi:hypothetical protein
MDQPIPRVSAKDVKRIALREFDEPQIDQVYEILNDYGKEAHETEIFRVQVDAIKLSEGSIEKLKEFVSKAKQDYRDIIMYAEYSIHAEKAWDDFDLPKKEEKKLFKQDWKEYKFWFKNKSRQNKTRDQISGTSGASD